GQYLHANLSAQDRASLVNYVKVNKPYQYNPKQVVKSTLGGEKVYIYKVTYNTGKLTAYNTKAAALFGISSSDIKRFMNDQAFDSLTSAVLYVDAGTKQMVRLESKDFYGNKQVTDYRNFNQASRIQAPTAELPFSRLQPLLAIPAQTQSITY
ncbi:MAG TPA: hypothetical protein VIJ68_00760, partial [Candidatus Saccharimonadales bacterium]